MVVHAPHAPIDVVRIDHRETRKLAPAVEAGLLANVRITDGWGLVGGPLVEASIDREGLGLAVFVGLQRGL
jgi:hypothetical protein